MSATTRRVGAPRRHRPHAHGMPRLSLALGLALLVAVAIMPTAATGQEPDSTQVQGLTATQQPGFATLAWTPVPDATDYQIARTPVDADDVPTGPEVISGLWRPQRQVNQEFPTFADAGFDPGQRFRWRVRARFGTTEQPYSEPVFGTTLPASGPDEFLTQFETTLGAQFTSYESEIEWTERIDAASDRVRVVELGRTVQGRAINLFIIGHPAPLGTAAEISASPTVGSNCNVHGNEPSGREACFMMIRELAFSDDPWVIDILSNATVLFVPSINGDGRAANTRGNSTGQDLNRDYGRLTQPETQAMIRFFRDYTPEVINDGHEHGSSSTCDVSFLNTPQLNSAQSMFDEGKLHLIEGWMYDSGAADGWWPCPYPVTFSAGGQSFGNTTGHRHIVGMLTEARSGGGPTRPDEGNTASNRRRKVYSQLWTIRELLDYHRTRRAEIHQAIVSSIAFQTSNTGPIVFDGTYPWPAFPAPHPGQVPQPTNTPGPGDILEEPPCGYMLTPSQYTTELTDGGSLPAELRTTPQQRLEMHGIAVEDRPAGHVVRMRQPLRGLIPLILDAQSAAVGSIIITAAQRLTECPHADIPADPIAAAAVEGGETEASLTIGNETPEPDQPLNWAIGEATTSCESPSDLAWVDVDPASGSTAPVSSSVVTATFSTAGASAPTVLEGVLCVATNDPGDPLVTVPVRFQVQYPVSGPLVAGGITSFDAGRSVPVRFSLDGFRGDGSAITERVASRPVECASLDALGEWEQHPTGGFSYDPATDRYRYAWWAPSAWAGTCRQLLVAFDDGSEHFAVYRFHR